jgi:hypothetical protein
MHYWMGLCVLHRTCRQDYETLFHVVILNKHHHHDSDSISAVISLYFEDFCRYIPTLHLYRFLCSLLMPHFTSLCV